MSHTAVWVRKVKSYSQVKIRGVDPKCGRPRDPLHSLEPLFCHASRSALAAVHLVLHSRAAARVQAGSPAVVDGHSNGPSHWICACRSRPGKVVQLVRRVWPSNSGALSSVGRTKYQLPHRAPPTTLISTLHMASTPSATGRASPTWCYLGMPFQWSVSNALRAA